MGAKGRRGTRAEENVGVRGRRTRECRSKGEEEGNKQGTVPGDREEEERHVWATRKQC